MKSKVEYLREAIRVSQESRARGNHPFGAVLHGAM
jgi:tRNA(Arg) A34 adenosine deaminase TadA